MLLTNDPARSHEQVFDPARDLDPRFRHDPCDSEGQFGIDMVSSMTKEFEKRSKLSDNSEISVRKSHPELRTGGPRAPAQPEDPWQDH